MGLFFKVSLLGTAEDRASPGRVTLCGQPPGTQRPKYSQMFPTFVTSPSPSRPSGFFFPFSSLLLTLFFCSFL